MAALDLNEEAVKKLSGTCRAEGLVCEGDVYKRQIWEDLLDQLTYSDLSRLCAVGLRMTVSL